MRDQRAAHVARAVGVLLALTACTQASPSDPSPAASNPCSDRVPISGYEGTVYLVSGRNNEGLPLYRLDLSSGCFRQIASRVATVSSDGRTAIAADVSTIGTPVVKEIHGDTLRPIAEVPVYGMMPAMSPDGRIASVEFLMPGFGLNVWDPHRRKSAGWYADERELRRPQWRPDGSILVLRSGAKRTHLVSIDPTGEAHVLGSVPEDRWMDAGVDFVHVTDLRRKTVIYNLDTWERRELRGWYGVGWDPGGEVLLLGNDAGQIGFASAPRFETVSGIVDLPVSHVWGAAWIQNGTPPSGAT